MYEQYFGFTRTPFRLESEPDMFFFGESQKNVLNCIKKSLSLRKGLITLSGLPGAGKTTVMRRAIEESIVPDSVICRINRSRCQDFLETLKQEISARQKQGQHSGAQGEAQSPESQITELHQLVENAVKEKKHFLVVIDESQQLTEAEVDVLFSLVSIEKASRKHFKFLLVSHEPFHEYFDVSQYENSDELLSTHCLLLPLLTEEILPYIEHRLGNAGWKGSPSFSREIEHLVFLVTQGIPRRINSFFDRLMLFSYFEKNHVIDNTFVKCFCRDLLAELESQPHPDLDSFDLRQALRREYRLFGDTAQTEESKDDVSSGYKNSKNNVSTSSFDIDEPLASEDPEQILLFVSRFISNPERYKNYTDQYYEIPKSLTLLLCLATESDRYIDDITPIELSSSSPADIKSMMAVFVEKMLITSRFNAHRILGLDNSATDDEINRHFSYMMRICRSDYVKSNREEFETVIKEAYIKLLSKKNISDDDIPIVDDVLEMPAKSAHIDELNMSEVDDDTLFDHSAVKKIAELEKAKRILNESSTTKLNPDLTKEMITVKKRSLLLPLSFVGLAIAAGVGYVFLGTGLLVPTNNNNFQSPLATTMVTKEEKVATNLNPQSKPKNEAAVDNRLTMLNELNANRTDNTKMPKTKEVLASHAAVKQANTTNKKSQIMSEKRESKVSKSTDNAKSKKDSSVNVKQKNTSIVTKQSTAINDVKSKIPQENKKPKVITSKSVVEKPVKTIPKVSKPVVAQSVIAEAKSKVAKQVITNPAVKPVIAKSVATNTIASKPVVTNATKPKSKIIPEVKTSIPSKQLVATASLVKVVDPLSDKSQFDRVMSNFKYGYENGDTDELAAIFSENAVTNEGFNREQIIEDYEMLFDESDKRSVVFEDIVWDKKKDYALGLGKFKTAIIGDQDIESEGEISIKLIRVDNKVKIKQLFFLYRLAEVE